METITKDAAATKALGRQIADQLKGGEVLALIGDLGAGKTTFIQGVAEGLGIKNNIISPTFILMRSYQTDSDKVLYHLDLYRLEQNIDKELQNLGLDDIWGKDENVVVIEWADRAKELLPKNTKWIEFEYLSEDERKVKYTL